MRRRVTREQYEYYPQSNTQYENSTHITIPPYVSIRKKKNWMVLVKISFVLLSLILAIYVNFRIQANIIFKRYFRDGYSDDILYQTHDHYHSHLTAHRGLPVASVPSSVDPQYINEDFSPCVSLYSRYCGNYKSQATKILGTARTRNMGLVDLVESSIRTEDLSWCFGVRCKPMSQFYKSCIHSRSTDNLRRKGNAVKENYMEKYRSETKNATSPLDKIAYMITHGYVSPLSVKRDSEGENDDFKTSSKLLLFLRSSGLFKSMRFSGPTKSFIHKISSCRTNKPYEEQVQVIRQKKRLLGVEGLVTWISRGDAIVEEEWRRFFSKITRWASRKSMPLEIESIWSDDPGYLRCLSDMLLEHKPLENVFSWSSNIDAALESYVRYSLDVFDKEDCMSLTKHFYPMSTCSWFMNLQHRGSGLDDNDPIMPHAKSILHRSMSSIKRELLIMNVGNPEEHMEVELRFGECWGILDNKAQSLSVSQIESESIPLEMVDINEIMRVQFFNHRKWSSSYNPIELKQSIPDNIANFNDPLRWYAQTNAWYDPFHDTITFTPGILTPPVYTPLYDSASASMLVFIIVHEWTHRMQYLFDPMCVVNAYGNDMTHWEENMADVFGLRVAYNTYLGMIESNSTLVGMDDGCDFFSTYAQMWCSGNPEGVVPKDPHASPKARVDGVMTLISEEMRHVYNRCFGCAPANSATCSFKTIKST